MQTVIETENFIRDARAVGMSNEERGSIIATLSRNPLMGDVMPGTGGARKVRFAPSGKGKRGGYRTIHYFGGHDVPVFLLAVLKKNERADLSQPEKNELRKELQGLADDYRASARKKIKIPKGK